MFDRLLEVGGDLAVLAAVQHAERGDARDFLREADAARALDAAGHGRLDDRAHILVVDGALVLVEAGERAAIGHRLVLKVAFAALVADRAVERVVDEQELHHPFARLLHHRRVGADRLAVGGRQRAARLRLGRPRRDLDQAHAAVAGDRQPLVIAEARDLLARKLARLQHGRALRDFDLDAVDGDLRHQSPSFRSSVSRRVSMCVTRGPPLRAASSAITATTATMMMMVDVLIPPPPACLGAVRSAMRRSSSGRKWRIRPWIGQAAASPSAQMVWPSTCLVTSSSLSMLADVGVAFAQPLHHAPHPAGAFAARRALAAALMLVEIGDAADRADDVGRLVHDDDRRGAEAGAERLQPVEIHRRVHDLGGRNERHRRTARDDREQIVPAAADAAGMPVDQLAEADRHGLLDHARAVHMAR